MKRRAKVELFERIRREYEFGVGRSLLEGLLCFALLAPFDIAVLHCAVKVNGITIHVFEQLHVQRAVVDCRRDRGPRLGG